MSDEIQRMQATAQERLVGPHYCPDWDWMRLDPGAIEFSCCTCKPDCTPFETIAALKARLEEAKEVLVSIAKNSCCEPCQQAGLVARAFLAKVNKL